jgi:hypothetical protein
VEHIITSPSSLEGLCTSLFLAAFLASANRFLASCLFLASPSFEDFFAELEDAFALVCEFFFFGEILPSFGVGLFGVYIS